MENDTPVIETEEIETEQPEEIEDGLQTEETEASEEVTDAPDDSVIVTIGDEEPAKEDHHESTPFRELRKQYRDVQKELRELKARQQVQPEVPQLGKKPTLEDFDYDTDKFEASLVNWHEKKRQVDQIAEQRARAAEQQQKAWEERLQGYTAQKQALKVPDYEDAESIAQETFNQSQQGILLKAKNSALLVYALGKNPAKAKELAAMTDLVDFTYAVAEVQTMLKTTPRKPSVAPERGVQSSAPVKSAVSNRLEGLKAKAEKSGDYGEYFAAKRALKK